MIRRFILSIVLVLLALLFGSMVLYAEVVQTHGPPSLQVIVRGFHPAMAAEQQPNSISAELLICSPLEAVRWSASSVRQTPKRGATDELGAKLQTHQLRRSAHGVALKSTDMFRDSLGRLRV